MKLLIIIFLPLSIHAQSFRQYLPSLAFTALAGASDGLRDASLFRMDGYSQFWNGKQSWTNKYRNHDKNAGPAFFGSTNVFVAFTDGAHLSNAFTHEFESMALVTMPTDNNQKLGHLLLKAAIITAVRGVGHSIVYDVVFKPRK